MTQSVPIPLVPIETRYRPLIELGRGGTARVYLADSLTAGLKKLVVLKILEPELSVDEEMRQLFRREAEVCARLNHPNIVQVNEVIEQASGPVIVMEYVEGVSLSQVISKSAGRFPQRLQLHAITQLLAGLHYFHELRDYDRITALKPVHRDVSPQNVIVMYEGAVKVLDFGIAKLANQDNPTRTGIVKGKVQYMPAEQLLSDTMLDRRADIFAAGIMLWEALAQRRIWQGMAESDIFHALLRDEVPNLRKFAPNLPDYFYSVVKKATAHAPCDRYETALELQLEIEKMLGEMGGLVQPRELARFMQTEFADWRHEQESSITNATSHPVSAKWGYTASREYTPARIEGYEHSHTPSRVSPNPSQKSSRRWWLTFGALAILAVGFTVAFFINRGQMAEQANAASSARAASLRSINIAIGTSPIGALILLDGRPLGRSPWQGTLPAKAQVATLEVREDHYEPISKVVSLNEDIMIDIQLRAITVPAPPEPIASDKRPLKDKPNRHWASKPSAKASSKCNPPYELSSDGIRIYKEECF